MHYQTTMRKVLLFLTLTSLGLAVQIPANFEKCKLKEPNFEKCVQNNIVQLTKPFPEVKIPNLEPYEVSELTIGQGTGPVALQQKFKNCKVYGLHKLQVEKFRFDFEKKKLEVRGTFPDFRKLCDYEMSGRILLLPVNGSGKSTIILKNLKITGSLKFEEKNTKGKTYIHFTNSALTLDPELVSFNFVNSRNKQITDHLNPVLNENWKEVFDDVKSSYSKLMAQIVLRLCENFFSKVSVQEAFEDNRR